MKDWRQHFQRQKSY